MYNQSFTQSEKLRWIIFNYKINGNRNIFILLRLYYYNQPNTTKQVKMINALILRPPSSESIQLEVQHMQICIETDYTTISTLHKLIDKWLTQSVQNSCNSLHTFKPVFKIFSLILITSFKRGLNSYDDQLFLCSLH